MRKVLGRGLDALIPMSSAAQQDEAKNGTLQVPIEKIRPNRLQPRHHFDAERLSDLTASIRENGLLQPLVVSYDQMSDTYELIAGERRLRACELAGLTHVDVVLRKSDSDQKRLVQALVENLQREDLNPIEEANGYMRLIKEYQLQQTDVAKMVGKSKSTVSNTLRLLDLSEEIQKAVDLEQITEGHARALLTMPDPVERHKLFQKILNEGLSVREAELLCRTGFADAKKSNHAANKAKPADLHALETALQQILGTKVEIRTRKDQTKGQIVVHFFSLEDFDRIVKMIQK